ncbi:protein C10-like [Anneissia japonica]|uniref:protein C10-like n=1 Tax=Anneissia japonica TaxID=1529436 RepID=UPI0014254BF1|nr:protein C10-like [Anneissia japonica]
MSKSQQVQQPSLTTEETKVILTAVLEAFSNHANRSQMEEVRDAAGNDMMKMMQTVFPVATQIQQQVIQKYGFTADGEGAIKFTQEVRRFEHQDPEIASLAQRLKAIFLPPLPVNQPAS